MKSRKSFSPSISFSFSLNVKNFFFAAGIYLLKLNNKTQEQGGNMFK